MKDILVTIGEAILMIILVVILWAVMSVFNMGYCIMSICRNTPKIVGKVTENKERYLFTVKRVLQSFI